jgi:Tfp pilus assembly protein PilO
MSDNKWSVQGDQHDMQTDDVKKQEAWPLWLKIVVWLLVLGAIRGIAYLIRYFIGSG